MQPTEMIAMVSSVLMLTVLGVTLMRSLFAAHRRRIVARMQTELFNRLVDKIGSSQELLAWLQTDAGQNLFKFNDDPEPRIAAQTGAPYARVLNAVQAGLLLSSVSIGLLILNNYIVWNDRDSHNVGLCFGGLGLAAGIGLLASAVASWWLGRNWGLIQTQKQNSLES